MHWIFFLFVFFLTACSIPVTVTVTAATPSSTTSPSLGIILSSTPRSTRTLTPLPTIPTFTPTFDARTIVTVTPAPRAECPKEDDSLKLNFKINDDQTDVSQQMLKFLNSGGSMKTVVNELTKVSGNSWFKFSDLTNDAQPDLVFIGFQQAVDTFYITNGAS